MVRKKFIIIKVIKGCIYQYFCKDGKYVCLFDDLVSEEYDKVYWCLMCGGDLVECKIFWNNLILFYKKSLCWIDFKFVIKCEYICYFEYFCERVGIKDMQKFQCKYVIVI